MNTPVARVSRARNIAFVNGDVQLLKSASLYFEHVFSTEQMLGPEESDLIRQLNKNGDSFVHVSRGRQSRLYYQAADDWRSIDNIPESEGMAILRHSFFPSDFGLLPSGEGDNYDQEVLIQETIPGEKPIHGISIPDDGLPHALMTVPKDSEIADIVYVKRYGISDYSHVDPSESGAPGIVLSNIGIVDVSNSSWEQISEIHKDGNFLSNIRRLRLFVRDNFDGKSVGYIQDSFDQLIEDQDKYAKKHGLNITHGVLCDILKEKYIHAGVGASLAMALFQGQTEYDFMALIAAGASTALGAGNVSLSLVKNISEQRHKIDSPATYLIGINKKLGN